MYGSSINVILWGAHYHAEGRELSSLCMESVIPILAIKRGWFIEFNGQTIGTIPTTYLVINPYIVEMVQLKEWFQVIGVNSYLPSLRWKYTGASTRSLNAKIIVEIAAMPLGGKSPWISLRATDTLINMEYLYFLAFPLSIDWIQCMKNTFHSSLAFLECDYLYVLHLELHDHIGHLENVVAFDDVVNDLLGISAKDLSLLSSESEPVRDISNMLKEQ